MTTTDYEVMLTTASGAMREIREYDSLKAAKRGARQLFDGFGEHAGRVSIRGPQFNKDAEQRHGAGMLWHD